MAVKTGKLTYLDGSVDRVVITAGDNIRANREASKKGGEVQGGGDELLLYTAYIAAKRKSLPHTEGDFLDWADHVAEFDLDLTDEMIDGLLLDGQINQEQADIMRKHVTHEDVDEAGESPATPAS